MELKDFIKGAISDIAMAISELNSEMSTIGLTVNPMDESNTYNDCVRLNYDNDERMVKDIEFNLSISVSESSETGGGIRINVLSAGMNKEFTSSTVSTIRFSIPVVYPGSHARKKKD